MKSQVIMEKPAAIAADLLVLGFFQGTSALDAEGQALDRQLKGQLTELLAEGIFKGKSGEHFMLHTREYLAAKRMLLIGLGKKESFDGEALRKTAAVALRQAEKVRANSMALIMPETGQMSGEQVGQCLQEGLEMAAYRFDRYKKPDEAEQQPVTVSEVLMNRRKGMKVKELEKGIESGRILSKGVNAARDLVNEPPNVMDPTAMAEAAVSIARETGMGVAVLEREDMEKLGMGCFLGVTAGSRRPPKLVVLTYKGGGDASKEVIGLVGKGLTFDSGGISLKPGAGMDEMKGDMAGAAAVLGAMAAIGRLKPSVNVTAVVGLCENMPSGSAYRPGDILTAMNGKTVEILNTDAEGRLVLADCLAYAQHLGVTRVVDVATLTGACVIALGSHASGLVSNDETWQQAVVDAGKAVGEACWPLPAFDAYGEEIKSDVADLKNVGGREGGAITAGMFLKAFVKEIPWVHMDIAGTSYTKKPLAYQQKGGTGVAVRTLVQLVSHWKS